LSASALSPRPAKRLRQTVLPFAPNSQPQRDACTAAERILLFGGARGGGKSTWACGRAIDQLVRYPGNRIVFVRKTLKALRNSTFTTFLRLCPKEIIASINRQDLVVRFKNGSEALFIQADVSKDPLLEELKSVECSVIVLEEMTQLQEAAFHAAMLCKDRWVTPAGVRPPAGLWATCNPEIGWVKDMWYDRHVAGTLPDGWRFVQCLPSDNPALSGDYISDMAHLPPDLQARYLRGEWTAPADPARLIAYELVRAGIDGESVVGSRQILGVDVAFEGRDEAIIQPVDFDRLGRWEAAMPEAHKGLDSMQLAEQVHRVWLAGGGSAVVIVDSTGEGSGLSPILERKGIRCIRYKGGHSPLGYLYPKLEFRNMRDETWWHVRQELAAGRGTLPDDRKLEQDLISPRYRIGGERRVEVERKEEMKQRLGRSPDRGDALGMALMADRMGQAGGPRRRVIG